jgi:hypothetical protein
LDLITTNSGNTFDKTITSVFTLYSEISNDTIVVNYGDSFQQILQLNSSKEN